MVDLTDEPAHRPTGFDLAETWRGIVARMDEQRNSQRVRALADPPIIGWLRGHFGKRLSVGNSEPDGRICIEIGFGAAHNAAVELAGYGSGLEVLEPDEVRHQLAVIGARLVDRYGDSS